MQLEGGVPNLVPEVGRIIHSDGPKGKSDVEDVDMHFKHSRTQDVATSI